MQTAGIMMSLVLSIIGFLSICLKTYRSKKKKRRSIKTVLFGSALGAFFAPLICWPIQISEIVQCCFLGAITSEILLFFYFTVKNTCKDEKTTVYYDDGSSPKFFITGDKHRDFEKVKQFCREMSTRRKDVLIILGDVGLNYYEDVRDDNLKKEISELNITLFCLHGNKENRPGNIGTYGVRSFCGGRVYYEPKYPNIYFAIDGEIYHFEGRKYMVVGGAHSVDKLRCIEEGKPFWEDEMPDEEIKAKVEEALRNEDNEIFGMMTHTCPIDYLPTEMFLSTKQKAAHKRKPQKASNKKIFEPDIDRSTEQWLGTLEQKLDYRVWFCGHYHVDKQLDKVCMMYNEIRPLHMGMFGDAQ